MKHELGILVMNRNSYSSCRNQIIFLLVFTVLTVRCGLVVTAQDSKLVGKSPDEKYGVWNKKENAEEEGIYEMRLRVHPQAAPVPTFRHRLVPDPKDRVDGNSAIFYLKAMGFFEETNSLVQLRKLERKWRDEAAEGEKHAPDTWADAAPGSLPMDLVKKYLELHWFQEDLLYDAARRTRFEHDRMIEREPNPIGYLLPSIQQHRQLTRVQNIRCRYAIAQGRIEDAVEIVGQMMTMGHHLGSDEFLVSCLVGVACHGIAVDAGLVLSQEAGAPNLYWAIAACPDRVSDIRRALEYELDLLFLQMPLLKEISEKVRPAKYWSDFIERLEKVRSDSIAMALTSDESTKPLSHAEASAVIDQEYSRARKFLNEVVGFSDKQLDKYPKAQVVFLAVVKYYEYAQDELMKQYLAPYTSQLGKEASPKLNHWRSILGLDKEPFQNDCYLAIGELLTPPLTVVRDATARTEQLRNLWQTIEALRLTAAENGGQFPESLEQLAVPAPLDPATNRPFEYSLSEGNATLRGERIHGVKHHILVELASREQQTEDKK